MLSVFKAPCSVKYAGWCSFCNVLLLSLLWSCFWPRPVLGVSLPPSGADPLSVFWLLVGLFLAVDTQGDLSSPSSKRKKHPMSTSQRQGLGFHIKYRGGWGQSWVIVCWHAWGMQRWSWITSCWQQERRCLLLWRITIGLLLYIIVVSRSTAAVVF